MQDKGLAKFSALFSTQIGVNVMGFGVRLARSCSGKSRLATRLTRAPAFKVSQK